MIYDIHAVAKTKDKSKTERTVNNKAAQSATIDLIRIKLYLLRLVKKSLNNQVESRQLFSDTCSYFDFLYTLGTVMLCLMRSANLYINFQRSSKVRLVSNYECSFILSCFEKC